MDNAFILMLIITFVGGLATAFATGIGALPFYLIKDVPKRTGAILSALAAGMMAAASVLLITEASRRTQLNIPIDLALGVLAGIAFLQLTEHHITKRQQTTSSRPARRLTLTSILIVAAMTAHSLPEGIAVGVGFGSAAQSHTLAFGYAVCIAIAIHNIPEGLAIGLALRAQDVSPTRCVAWSIFTSLPQPLAAVPAAAMVWLFEPLLSAGMGFAGGAMLALVLTHLLPESVRDAGRLPTLAATTAGAIVMTTMMILTGFVGHTM
ncbi:MAG: ZIP family metal transporter [Planctomycetota bacterium]